MSQTADEWNQMKALLPKEHHKDALRIWNAAHKKVSLNAKIDILESLVKEMERRGEKFTTCLAYLP